MQAVHGLFVAGEGGWQWGRAEGRLPAAQSRCQRRRRLGAPPLLELARLWPPLQAHRAAHSSCARLHRRRPPTARQLRGRPTEAGDDGGQSGRGDGRQGARLRCRVGGWGAGRRRRLVSWGGAGVPGRGGERCLPLSQPPLPRNPIPALLLDVQVNSELLYEELGLDRQEGERYMCSLEGARTSAGACARAYGGGARCAGGRGWGERAGGRGLGGPCLFAEPVGCLPVCPTCCWPAGIQHCCCCPCLRFRTCRHVRYEHRRVLASTALQAQARGGAAHGGRA